MTTTIDLDPATPADERERLLRQFGKMSEPALAKLLNVKAKTLKNLPRARLPKFSKMGRERVFDIDSVREFIEARTVDQHTVMRRAREKPATAIKAAQRRSQRKPRRTGSKTKARGANGATPRAT